ncbi:MAG: helix-turn-helix transcriptional regulator [Clostridia bacterium]|nr:helix-turn-helix transcriptional regulator [Clostridia bacterium]
MQTITQKLLEGLKNADDIKAFLDLHKQDFLSQTLTDYLNELINDKDVTVAKIAKGSGIGEYVYKIFSGERRPTRDVLISVAFGMELSIEETQLLLRIAKFAILDSREKRDSVIIYALSHNMSVFKCDDLLNENNLITLI